MRDETEEWLHPSSFIPHPSHTVGIFMTRIFLNLAIVDFFGLLACFVSGLVLGSQEAELYLVHFHFGLWTTIGNLALHCLIFIYFLGTGRWVKEVAQAYKLADSPLPRLTRDLKRRTFPPALFAMLVPIAATASGLGAQMREWPGWIHLTLAIASLLINLWAFRIEYRNVRTNAEVIEDVLREVDCIRAERGLPSNAEALREEGVR
jgi:hypothetical protein